MSRLRVPLQPAYVLSARAYRDSSLLVEAWTLAHGRVGLVARGARSARSRSRGLLQAHRPLLMSWTETGELGSLTGVEAAGPAHALTGERVFCGWYLSELLLKLLARGDPHPRLFEAYAQALVELSCERDPPLRRFEKRLLAELGYGLDLPVDLEPAAYYQLGSEAGVTPVAPGTPGAVRGASLIAVRDEQFDVPEHRREARELLGRALRQQLGGRVLESARLLREMRRRWPAQD